MIIKIIAWGVYGLIEGMTALAAAPKKFVDRVNEEVEAIYSRGRRKRESVIEYTCCKKPDVQTFGPNEVVTEPTKVCMFCGTLEPKEKAYDL